MRKEIQAVSVHHGTPVYTELMLRSLRHWHESMPGLRITVMDNRIEANNPPQDRDELARLLQGNDALASYCKDTAIPVIDTPQKYIAAGNSHGEILRHFVLEHAQADYFLFLDSDIVFLQETIPAMLRELEAEQNAFGVQAWLHRDVEQGVREWSSSAVRYLNMLGGRTFEAVKVGTPAMSTPQPYRLEPRLHPICTLIKNSATFLRVAKDIGFSVAHTFEAAGGRAFDTLGLATKVMQTHGFKKLMSEQIVLHFSGISCGKGSRETDAQCEKFLSYFRRDRALVDELCREKLKTLKELSARIA